MNKLVKYFKIKPNDSDPIYKSRLVQEIDLIESLGLTDWLVKTTKIFNQYIGKYPYLLRGSAGSSLLLYYLGINQIDPIKYSIGISRFINKSRKTLPDIDIDVPFSIRNELIVEIIRDVPNTIRMSSNYKQEDNKYFEDLIKEDPTLNMLHSSGIVIYSKEQVDLVEKNKVLPNQIGLTKDNIGLCGLKKIDLLANTGLEQLYKISSNTNISEYNFLDPKVYEFIGLDDGIGITFAETPQTQYVFKTLKPSGIDELALCLAIIRPFACHNIISQMNWDYLKKQIIYDDDFIEFLKNKMSYSEDKADEIRRIFKKKDNQEQMNQFIETVDLSLMDKSDKYKLKQALWNMNKYSFCKAHSINYARMIYCLYWNKLYKPKLFWKSTIKSIKGFYRDWVYVRKGLDSSLKFKGIESCSPFYHLIYTGYWIKKEFVSRCYLKQIEISQSNSSEEKLNQIDIGEELEILEDLKLSVSNDDNNGNDDNNNCNNNSEDINISNDLVDYKNNLFTQINGEAENVENVENVENEDIEFTNNYIKSNSLNDNLVSDEEFDGVESKEKIKYDTMYEFRGVIAGIGSISNKYKKYQMVIVLGYDNNKFISLHLNKRRDLSRFKQVIGKGYWINGIQPYIVVTKMILL